MLSAAAAAAAAAGRLMAGQGRGSSRLSATKAWARCCGRHIPTRFEKVDLKRRVFSLPGTGAPSSRSKASQKLSTPSRGQIHSSTNGRAKGGQRFARRRSERHASPSTLRRARPESPRAPRESRHVCRQCLPGRCHRRKQRAEPRASAVRWQSRPQQRVCVPFSFP
jgi:hypothetical protein